MTPKNRIAADPTHLKESEVILKSKDPSELKLGESFLQINKFQDYKFLLFKFLKTDWPKDLVAVAESREIKRSRRRTSI